MLAVVRPFPVGKVARFVVLSLDRRGGAQDGERLAAITPTALISGVGEEADRGGGSEEDLSKVLYYRRRCCYE